MPPLNVSGLLSPR